MWPTLVYTLYSLHIFQAKFWFYCGFQRLCKHLPLTDRTHTKHVMWRSSYCVCVQSSTYMETDYTTREYYRIYPICVQCTYSVGWNMSSRIYRNTNNHLIKFTTFFSFQYGQHLPDFTSPSAPSLPPHFFTASCFCLLNLK